MGKCSCTGNVPEEICRVAITTRLVLEIVENRGRIHVATAFDRNYILPFHALATSLVRNHPPGSIEIHAITEGLTELEQFRIADMITDSGNRINFYRADPLLTKQFVLPGKWSSAVYYRLFFAGLIPESVSRIVYLDCDTIVQNSLEPLFNVDLEGHPVGAVYDNYVRRQPLLGIDEEGEYFNSGVMIIDMKLWRQQQIAEKASRYLLDHPDRILFVDQCGLNAVLRNNWKKLDSRFNLMYSVLDQDASFTELEEVRRDAVVIHYTLQRPWQMLCKNRLRHLYFYYLGASGVAGLPWHGYTDFEVGKIPAWLMIRIREFYLDNPLLQRMWRAFRSK